MSQDAKPFALVERFTVRPGFEAEFDQLVKDTVVPILRNEAGVMRYLCYEVDTQPRRECFTRSTRAGQPSKSTKGKSTRGTF